MTPIATQTRSFTEWRRVADRLLKQETALSQARTASSSHETLADLEAAVIRMRQHSDGLFAVAMAEAARDRSRAEKALLAGTSTPVEGFGKPTLA
jgi:hypothetical protein